MKIKITIQLSGIQKETIAIEFSLPQAGDSQQMAQFLKKRISASLQEMFRGLSFTYDDTLGQLAKDCVAVNQKRAVIIGSHLITIKTMPRITHSQSLASTTASSQSSSSATVSGSPIPKKPLISKEALEKDLELFEQQAFKIDITNFPYTFIQAILASIDSMPADYYRSAVTKLLDIIYQDTHTHIKTITTIIDLFLLLASNEHFKPSAEKFFTDCLTKKTVLLTIFSNLTNESLVMEIQRLYQHNFQVQANLLISKIVHNVAIFDTVFPNGTSLQAFFIILISQLSAAPHNTQQILATLLSNPDFMARLITCGATSCVAILNSIATIEDPTIQGKLELLFKTTLSAYSPTQPFKATDMAIGALKECMGDYGITISSAKVVAILPVVTPAVSPSPIVKKPLPSITSSYGVQGGNSGFSLTVRSLVVQEVFTINKALSALTKYTGPKKRFLETRSDVHIEKSQKFIKILKDRISKVYTATTPELAQSLQENVAQLFKSEIASITAGQGYKKVLETTQNRVMKIIEEYIKHTFPASKVLIA